MEVDHHKLVPKTTTETSNMGVHEKFDNDEETEIPSLEKKEETGEQAEGEDAEAEKTTKRKRKRKRKKKSGDAPSDAANGNANANEEGGKDKLNSLEHTVFVEGIPFVCTEDEVKGFFVSNGCADVLQMRLPT